jgi:hypothetical protein
MRRLGVVRTSSQLSPLAPALDTCRPFDYSDGSQIDMPMMGGQESPCDRGFVHGTEKLR